MCDRAAARRERAREQREQSRLAGAVRADERDELAGRKLEVGRPERDAIAVAPLYSSAPSGPAPLRRSLRRLDRDGLAEARQLDRPHRVRRLTCADRAGDLDAAQDPVVLADPERDVDGAAGAASPRRAARPPQPSIVPVIRVVETPPMSSEPSSFRSVIPRMTPSTPFCGSSRKAGVVSTSTDCHEPESGFSIQSLPPTETRLRREWEAGERPADLRLQRVRHACVALGAGQLQPLRARRHLRDVEREVEALHLLGARGALADDRRRILLASAAPRRSRPAARAARATPRPASRRDMHGGSSHTRAPRPPLRRQIAGLGSFRRPGARRAP